MAFVTALLGALAAIPALAGYVEKFAAWVTAWYIGNSKSDVNAALANAASIASHAESQDDRIKAAQAWVSALSKPRISP
jgi:hypothetical protein